MKEYQQNKETESAGASFSAHAQNSKDVIHLPHPQDSDSREAWPDFGAVIRKGGLQARHQAFTQAAADGFSIPSGRPASVLDMISDAVIRNSITTQNGPPLRQRRTGSKTMQHGQDGKSWFQSKGMNPDSGASYGHFFPSFGSWGMSAALQMMAGFPPRAVKPYHTPQGMRSRA
jgi:hypothetical protein